MTPAEHAYGTARLDAYAGDAVPFATVEDDADGRIARARFLIRRAAHIRRYTPGFPLAEALSRRAGIVEDLHLACLEVREAERATAFAVAKRARSMAAEEADKLYAAAEAEERHLKHDIQGTLDALDGLRRMLRREGE